jgi:Domain of unknown function (DUF4268)/Endonuclease NucS
MPLYRAAKNKLEAVKQTSFVEEKFFERKDLQRLLKADISVIGDDLMVISEEFGEWDASNRRIDLLCLDKQARLVVVEIKRTDDGGHMELQAIRYAAMLSSMTLDQAIAAYARNLGDPDSDVTARREILEFLELDTTEDAELTDEVRIILVSANFSTEITTSVIWLNRHGIDIICIRLKPYRMNDELLIDVAQIIPLPEAADYEIKVRAQAQEIKKVRGVRQEIFRRFWTQYIERSKLKTALYANRSTSSDHWLSAGIGRGGFTLNASITEHRARIECYISMGKDSDSKNKAAFHALYQIRTGIEQTFGGELNWQELPSRIGCRICVDIGGGWKTPESDWSALQDCILEQMMKLELALKGPIQSLKI